MFPRKQMSIPQEMVAVMGQTFLLATPLMPLSFPGRTHVLSTCQGRKDGVLLSVNPQGQCLVKETECACGEAALPREETEAQSLTASLLFLRELPHEADVGKLRSRCTLRSSSPLATPPPRWLVYQERQWARQRELVPDVSGPLQQPVLDWPPSVLPAMWDDVFLITL